MVPLDAEAGCVAFCFLTRELPLQSELWYEFFREGERLGLPFVVVVHAKVRARDASPAHVARHYFKTRCVARPVDTAWGTVSLVEATLALWQAALDRAPRTTHLALLSESCAPLCGFEACWRAIRAFSRTTFDVRPRRESAERFEELKDATLISPEHRRKQSQWFVCAADDARWFVARAAWTARWGDSAFGADEHYFISLMAEHGRDFDDVKTTFNDWGWRARFPHARPHVDAETRRTWLPHVFDRVDAATIDALRAEGFLFLRKVAAHAVVELDLLLGAPTP